MPASQVNNPKGTVKRTTTNDLPYSPIQPVISKYTAVSTLNQNVINLNFSVDQSLVDQFILIIDGKTLTIGSSNDFTFTSIQSDNTSSQVTLNYTITANLNIQAIKLGLKKESEFLTDNRFTAMYAYLQSGMQAFVDQTPQLTPTTTGGTPAAGTFYSSIPNRASMIDLTQDLRARMGVQRVMVNSVYQIQNERGPNGENVWGALDDTFGQIRLVGNPSPTISTYGAYGMRLVTQPGDGYVEVTFYGTGLNVLTLADGGARTFQYSVDGSGSFTTYFSTTMSGVIGNRNYAPNLVINAIKGLALGVHTVQLQNSSGSLELMGVEFLNESSSVKVQPGVGYNKGQQVTTSAQSIFSYSSSVTGVRGGRVVVYQSSAGAIGNVFQAVNAAQANFSSADHTNEDLARTYHWREFGAGRADDFSLSITSGTNYAFTLDDDTTTLAVNQANVSVTNNAISMNSSGFITITFVGTGLDVQVAAPVGTYTTDLPVLVDGTSIGNLPVANSQKAGIVKIVSGLPYGTHTVKFNRTASTNGIEILNFKAYQPKKPTIPSGAMEVADYNVLATFSANSTPGAEFLATGVLRKAAYREQVYVGATWTIVLAVGAGTAGATAGVRTLSATTGASVSYTFFGTGLDLRWSTPGVANTFTMVIDGTNPTAAGATASGFYGTGVVSFVAGTGVATTNATGLFGAGVWVSGLALGMHTVTFTQNNANSWGFESMDVIVPIHSYKSNIYADLQNTLNVGSQSISDNRQTTPVKDALPAVKAWAQAVGLTSNPTVNTANFVPMPDMSVTIKTSGGPIFISYSIAGGTSVSGDEWSTAIFVDGVQAGNFKISNTELSSANSIQTIADSFMLQVGAGTHKVEVYWASNTTATAYQTQRNLTVQEK